MRSRASFECKLEGSHTISKGREQEFGVGAIRIDFICRVSTDHVFDRLFTARVKFKESIYLENRILVDYDMFSFRNQALNVPATQQSVLPGRSGSGFLHRGKMR